MKMVVLIVDDDNGIRSLLEHYLRSKGLQVVTASDGEKGLAAYCANHERITKVLTDVTMPVMTGPQMVQAIRKHYPKKSPKITYMSGYARPVDLGDHMFILKPFNLKTIDEILT